LNGCDNNNQITIIDKDNFFYCDTPICNPLCKADISKCMPKKENIHVNKPEYNECKCNEGLTGEDCQTYIYEDLL